MHSLIHAAGLAAAPPGTAYGININVILAIFTGVILVLAGIFLGAAMLFRANRSQTSDNARTLLNAFMGLFLVALLAGGAGWYVVTHVNNAVVQGGK